MTAGHASIGSRPLRIAAALALVAVLGGCASPAQRAAEGWLPLTPQRGWFDGEEVVYVTTDVSDAAVAREKRANFAPRLADALRRGPQRPGQPSAVDPVYAVTNFTQGSIFASAPQPVGHRNLDTVYTPLWRMVTVTWVAGSTPRTLTSQEQVLAAADAGAVTIGTTEVVLNCPIVHRGPQGSILR